MIRQYGRKVGTFLLALIEPERQLLPDYMRQRPRLRAHLLQVLGIICAAALGAMYGRYWAKLPPNQLMILLSPLVLMAMLVVWVLPDRDTVPTRTMSSLLLAYVGVSVAWPDYMALQLPGLPWISFRRLLLAPMCLLLLVCLSTNAKFRKDVRETMEGEPIIWKLLAAFVLIQFLSIAGAKSPSAAIKNFLNDQIAWTAVFFVALYAFRDERMMLKAMRIFFIACLTIGIIAILEAMNKGVLWNGHIPSLLQVDLQTMSGTLKSEFRFGAYRAKSVYAQPLPFAEIMALVTPTILYFIFSAKNMYARLLFIVVDFTFLYVMTLPQSRLGLIGFTASHGIFILVWAGRIWLREKFSLLGPSITLAYPVMMIGLLGAIVSVGSLRERFVGGHATVYSDQTRKIQKIVSRGVILRSPIIGHGPRQGPAELGVIGYGRASLDNYLLWIALDYGLVGFAIYYGMLLFGLHSMFMVSIRGQETNNNLALMALTTIASFLLIKTVLSEEDNHSIIFMTLGMAMAVAWRDKVKSGALTKAAPSKASLSRPSLNRPIRDSIA